MADKSIVFPLANPVPEISPTDANEAGVELTDEQLAVASVASDIGDYINPSDCPRCGCNNLKDKGTYYICQGCGYKIENYN